MRHLWPRCTPSKYPIVATYMVLSISNGKQPFHFSDDGKVASVLLYLCVLSRRLREFLYVLCKF